MSISRSVRKNFKKGFTLIEIIIVVVIIGILVSLFYPSIMSNKDKAIINSTVGNDVKLLSGAITEWKTTSPDSNGTYSAITTKKVATYLPSGMNYDTATDTIQSSGLNGGIAYQIISDKINTNGDSFKVYADFTAAITNNNYDDRIKTYAETVAMDKWKKLSTDKTDTTTVGNADGLDAANADFSTGGTTTDGKSGTRKIVF